MEVGSNEKRTKRQVCVSLSADDIINKPTVIIVAISILPHHSGLSKRTNSAKAANACMQGGLCVQSC